MNSFEDDNTLGDFQAMIFNGQHCAAQPFTLQVATPPQSLQIFSNTPSAAANTAMWNLQTNANANTNTLAAATPTPDADPNQTLLLQMLQLLMGTELKKQTHTSQQEPTSRLPLIFEQQDSAQQVPQLPSWPLKHADSDMHANMDFRVSQLSGSTAITTFSGASSPLPFSLPPALSSPCSSDSSYSFTSAPRSPDSYLSQANQDSNCFNGLNGSFGSSAATSPPSSPLHTTPLSLPLSSCSAFTPLSVPIPPLPPAPPSPSPSPVMDSTATTALTYSQSCGASVSSSGSTSSCSSFSSVPSTSASKTAHAAWLTMTASQLATASHNRAAAKALLKSPPPPPPQQPKHKHKRATSDGASQWPARNSTALRLLHHRIRQENGDAACDSNAAKRSKYSLR